MINKGGRALRAQLYVPICSVVYLDQTRGDAGGELKPAIVAAELVNAKSGKLIDLLCSYGKRVMVG